MSDLDDAANYNEFVEQFRLGKLTDFSPGGSVTKAAIQATGLVASDIGAAPLVDLLSTVTAPAPLTVNKVRPVDATIGPVTMTALPALSGLAVGTRYGITKNDTSPNLVTVPFTAGDTTSTGVTSFVLAYPGTVEVQVVSNPAGGKFWRTVNHIRSDATLGAIADVRLPALELVALFGYGHSYVAGVNRDTGTTFLDRLKSRQNMGTYTNRGAGGTRVDQFLAAIQSTWTPGARGLVCIMGVLNDIGAYVDASGAATVREAFRSCLTYLSALVVQAQNATSFAYDANWSAGVSTGAGVVNFSWTGDAAAPLVTFGAGAKPAVTVKSLDGTTTYATVTTGGFKQSFTGAIPLSGFGPGTHTVQILAAGAGVAIIGAAIPNPAPPVIVWPKEARPAAQGDTNYNLLVGTYLPAMAVAAAAFPNVIPVDPDSTWDMVAMTSDDGVHPNMAGDTYYCQRIESVLRALPLTFRQGLNRIGTVATYTAPTAPAVGGGDTQAPTVPGTPTATAGTGSASVAFTGSTDNVAVTGYGVYSSADGYTAIVATGTASPITVTGLGATAVTFKVDATDGTNRSAKSAASNSVTPTASTVFVQDTFSGGTTGANLTAHTGEVGATWTQVTSSIVTTVDNRVRGNTAAPVYYSSGTPATADMKVAADLYVQTVLAASSAAVTARHQAGGDYYAARYVVSTTSWRLEKRVSGTTTALGTAATQTLTPGQTYRFELKVIGSALTLTVDGTVVSTATDSAVTAAGKAGLVFGGAATDTTGLHIDNLQADSL